MNFIALSLNLCRATTTLTIHPLFSLCAESADSCSLRCILYLRHSEILTGNLRGQMKKWDLRIADDKSILTFMLSGDQVWP